MYPRGPRGKGCGHSRWLWAAAGLGRIKERLAAKAITSKFAMAALTLYAVVFIIVIAVSPPLTRTEFGDSRFFDICMRAGRSCG